MVIVHATVTAKVLGVRGERARGATTIRRHRRAYGSADDQRAEISNSSEKCMITVSDTVEVTVDETFLDTFLDRRWSLLPELVQQQPLHELR